MSPKLKKFLQSWVINTLAVGLAGLIMHNHIHYQKPVYLLAASLLLGILNSVLKPIIMLLALPVLVLTLGLFMFVINALLLYFVGFLLNPYFSVDTFWSAFLGALIISIVSVVLNSLHEFRGMRGCRFDGGIPIVRRRAIQGRAEAGR